MRSESGKELSPKQTTTITKAGVHIQANYRPRPQCVWTFAGALFLLRGPRPGSASGMGGNLSRSEDYS